MNIKKQKTSLDRRRDVRTVNEFRKVIKETTLREKMLIEVWIKEMKHRGYIASYEDYGIDNTGELQEKVDNRPDYKVNLNEQEILIEVKANKISHKQTFKVHDIKKYISYNATILLVYGIGNTKEINYETIRWGLISTEKMSLMLKDLQVESGDRLWGNKPIIRVYPKDYDKYWKEEILTCQ